MLKIATAAAGPTVVGSLSELFPADESPPPDTEAVLVTSAGASPATLTISVIGG